MKTHSIQRLAEHVKGELQGNGSVQVSGIEDIYRASADQITFIGNRKYATAWTDSKAGAAIVQSDIDITSKDGRPFIRVKDADLAVAAILELFAPAPPRPAIGIDPRAVVDSSAQLGPGVAVGPLSYLGARVQIGAGTVIHPNVTIMDDCIIGAGCTLWPGVVIRERCEIGDGCILHNNVSIGADGFGFRPGPDGRSIVKIPQIGTVRIGRGVEIGAATCVDRAKFSETTIGDGTKIDNLCQIGHNCRIGRLTLIAGMVGIGGSVTIGDGVMLGGGSIIKDHVTIGDGARLGGQSGLICDLPAGETWHGHPAHEATATFKEFAVIRKLPELLKTVKRLEKSVNSVQS